MNGTRQRAGARQLTPQLQENCCTTLLSATGQQQTFAVRANLRSRSDDRRRVMNSADVADAMERTRESIDESHQLMADVPESIVRWITAALEPRRPRHCWSASVCRPDSPPNLLIETLRC